MQIKTRATTGLVLTVVLRRDADGFLYDWADGTFKMVGWTTVAGPMSEEAAPIPLGHYETAEIDTSAFTDGLYTAFIDGAERDPIEIRIKDGDIWEALLDVAVSTRQAAAGVGSGAGSVVTTITVKEDDTAGPPIPLVTVEIRTPAGTYIDRTFTTNSGEAVFALDPGVYEVFLTKTGVPYFFTRPITMTVPAASTYDVEFFAVPFVPIVPSEGAAAIVYDYLVNLGLDVRPGIPVICEVVRPSRTYLGDGPILTNRDQTKTNAQGMFQFSLPRQVDLLTPDVRYAITIDRVGFQQEFSAADLNAGGAIILSSLST